MWSSAEELPLDTGRDDKGRKALRPLRWERTILTEDESERDCEPDRERSIPSEDEPDRDFDRVVGPLPSLLPAAEVRDFSPGWDGPDDDQERDWDRVLLPAAGERDFSAAWDDPEDEPERDFDRVMGPLAGMIVAAPRFLWKIIKLLFHIQNNIIKQ